MIACWGDQYSSQMEACTAVAKKHNNNYTPQCIQLWHIEFMKNAYRWKESLRGKYTRCTVFDGNKLLRRATRKYLETVVTRKSTKANPNPAFRMQDFQDELNREHGLLHRYEITRKDLYHYDLYKEETEIPIEVAEKKEWCTVSNVILMNLNGTRRYRCCHRRYR